jgi:hypothetical protein
MDKQKFNYPDPVARLLTIGDPSKVRRKQDWRGGSGWPDYAVEFGIKHEHRHELIRMVTDEQLNQAHPDSSEIWAPIHAWRSLGQMKAVEAIEPLISLFSRVDEEDDDWVSEELPEVMGMIGSAGIPALSEYLASSNYGLWARVVASSSLENIGIHSPDARQACIKALTATLEKYMQNDELLNGEIIAALAALDAIEAAPLVEQAYSADRVDESVMGDWEDFQVEVGLLDQRPDDADEDRNTLSTSFENKPGSQESPSKREAKKEKNKRKQARTSRKKNRKK